MCIKLFSVQDLTDRGWRRSGKYCYKPDNTKMCCPLFIIRLDAPNFKLSKSQKKVLKKFNNYLLTGETKTQSPNMDCSAHKSSADDLGKTAERVQKKAPPKKGAGPDPLKPTCRKAKEIRRERRLLKESAKSGQTCLKEPVQSSLEEPVSLTKNTVKSLEGLLKLPPVIDNPAHNFEVRLVQSSPQSHEFRQSLADSYRIYSRYQVNIHKDDPNDLSMKQFSDFLVNSPLIPERGPSEWEEIGYGSYHQQYYLDGHLIMVGVVDILTNCISSKYLYYDTDYDYLNLGVVSALNEIKLVRQLHSSNPSLRYYCMGYYNHTCQKMRYKGQYTPSSLLCTATNTYVSIEKCLPKLDTLKYMKLADDSEPDEIIKNPIESYIDSTMLVKGRPYASPSITYNQFKMRTGKEISDIKEYGVLVGPVVAKRACYYIR